MRPVQGRQPNAYSTYLIMEGALAVFYSMIFTVNAVYQVQVAHLNPLQLVLVGTVLETTAFLFEVPTGVVADIYGRRRSIITGTILMGLGFALEGSVPRLEAILLAQVIWGIGYTFTSGAKEAWISDEIGEARAGRAFLRASQIDQVGALVGIPISIALASVMLQLPIILGGLFMSALGLVLIAFMRESGFKPSVREHRSSWQRATRTLRGGLGMVRRRPVLLTILGIAAIHGAFSEGFDRLWTLHLLSSVTLPSLGPLEPVAWFGLIRGAGLVLALGAMEIVRRRVDTGSHERVARALFVTNGLLLVGVIGFGLATDFTLAFVVLLAVHPLRRMNAPLQTAWVNQGLEPGVRATVISISSQSDAAGQIIGGPILGALATFVSTRAGMVAAALLLAPLLFLYARTLGTKNLVTTGADLGQVSETAIDKGGHYGEHESVV